MGLFGLRNVFLGSALALASIAGQARACNGTTPEMLEAVNTMNRGQLQLCLARGSDANAEQGEALVSSALRGEAEMVGDLLPHIRDIAPIEKALSLAVLRGHEHVFDRIMKDTPLPIDLNKPESRYLSYAARSGHSGILRKLHAAGARDDNGMALASAIISEQRAAFDFLLQEAGVSANAGNGMVLSVAMTSGDKHYVTALLDKGADAKAFPLIAETIADIRKQRDGTGTDAEKFKNPVYDEIIALVEAAIARQTTVAENPAPGPLAISEAPQRIGGPTGPAP